MCAKSGVPLPPSLMPLLSQKKDDKANQKSSRDTLKELTEVSENNSIKPEKKQIVFFVTSRQAVILCAWFACKLACDLSPYSLHRFFLSHENRWFNSV